MNGVRSTNSIGEVRIVLRDDLRFLPQQYAGESCYVIEDPQNSGFYRVGVAEYTLLSLFDGRHTIREAMHHATSVLGRDAFTEQDAVSISKWLVDSGLAKTHTSTESKRLHDKAEAKQKQSRKQYLNPIIAKVPVFCPESLLDRGWPVGKWLVSRGAFVVWCIVVAVALHQLATHWNTLVVDSAQLLSSSNWVWLGLTWVLLKCAHESFHALACRKYGGEVREAGIVLIALAPLCYVDVTSSWRFESKWQRIIVAAAGMYVELFIGAIAALVWIHTEPGLANWVAFNVLLLSTITTVLFNANPLMKFDGYYMLSDLLETPNLGPQGQAYLSYLGRRFIYGVKANDPLVTTPRGWFVRLYGGAAMLWRMFILVGICLVVAQLFHGAGLAIVMATMCLWLGKTIFQHATYLLVGQGAEQPQRLHFFAVSAALIMLTLGLSQLAPWPFAIKAPAVVHYEGRQVVRVGADGFVKQILVEPGQRVAAGQLLAVLENEQIEADLSRLKFAVEAAHTRARSFSRSGDVAALQAEYESLKALESQLQERQTQVDGLRVVAPRPGHVVSDEIESKVGLFLREGRELLTIGDESKKELVLSIAQQDAEFFQAHVGAEVNVKFRGGTQKRLALAMGSVSPGASMDIEHLAVAAAGGGPISVRPKMAKSGTDDGSCEFVKPRLSGSIPIDSEIGKGLRAGQLAMVRLPMTRSSLGEGLYLASETWIRERWRMIRQ